MTTQTRGQTPAAAPAHRGPWLKIAAALAAVGVLAVVLVLVGPTEPIRQAAVGVGFASFVVAAFTAAIGWVRGRGQRFGLLPHTGLGWTSVGVIVLGWAMTFVPSYIRVEGREANDLLTNVVIGGFGVMFIAGIMALVAVWRSGERSAPLIVIGVLAALFGPFFLLGELAYPH